ncbi:MAG TPA: hypothetical protein VL402_11980 [Xanthobacteraceae bacterium]|nr:hypothetical protein [Xanthobacteraceae bacterium]
MRRLPCVAAALILMTAAGFAAETSGTDTSGKGAESPTADSGSGASGETTAPDSRQPLHLTDAQRQQVRAAVAGEDTEVTFQLKATKSLNDFMPNVGGQIPSQLPAHAMPPSLAQQLPILANYQYVKVKNQILIVNPMTKKIIDIFPEAKG